MINVLKTRIKQKFRTFPYPEKTPPLPERFAGLPRIFPEKCCGQSCSRCAEVCPVSCVSPGVDGPSIDLGKCVFCRECVRVCPKGAIEFTKEHSLCATDRNSLVIRGSAKPVFTPLDKVRASMFRKSLRLRQVSAGGCAACELDTNVLNTLAWDLGRFGIQFVASPRHADGLLITGPVTENMALALKKTYAAVPEPKLVISVGSCAISGGLFRWPETESNRGADVMLPIDLYIPGCPPHPLTILDGLLRLIGRIK